MYEVRSDFGKNRLYLTVRGRMDLGEFKPFTISAIVEAKKLQPEFAIVLDISEFVPANEEVRQLMQDSMQKLREMGVGPVVRVVRPDAMVEASQWQHTSSRMVGNVAGMVESYEAADKKLDVFLTQTH